MKHSIADFFTTGEAARRLQVSRQIVSYAIERDGIQHVARAGIVRLFSPEQWPEVVKAVRLVQARRTNA